MKTVAFIFCLLLGGCANYSVMRTLDPPYPNPDDVAEFRSGDWIFRTYTYYCHNGKYRSFKYANEIIYGRILAVLRRRHGPSPEGEGWWCWQCIKTWWTLHHFTIANNECHSGQKKGPTIVRALIRTILTSTTGASSYQQNLQPVGGRNTFRLRRRLRSTVWCKSLHSIPRLQAWRLLHLPC